MKRRQCLQAISGGLGAVAAGCIGTTGDHETVQIINVDNNTDEEVSITMEIETQDGEAVFEQSYDVQPMDVKEVACVWPDEPLLIRGQRQGSDSWSEYETRDEDFCIGLNFRTANGELSIFTSERDCPHPFAYCHADDDNDDS